MRVLGVLLFVQWCLFVSAASSTPDWAAFGGGPDHSGYVPISIVPSSPSYTSSMIWSRNMSPRPSPPVIARGYVYVTVSGTILIMNDTTGTVIQTASSGAADSVGTPTIDIQNNRLYSHTVSGNSNILTSYDLSSYRVVGSLSYSQQWSKYPYGATVGRSGMVYFAGGYYMGILYAMNGTTGTAMFNVQLPRSCDSWTPTVYHDRVFFNSEPGSGANGVIGEINPYNGSVLWSTPVSSSWDGYSTYWVTAIRNDIAYVTGRNTNSLTVGAVDINNQHAYLWGYPCTKPTSFVNGGFQDYSPSVDDDYVYITCADGVYQYPTALNAVHIPTVKYACTNCAGKPVITNDTVIVGTSTSQTMIFNKTDGSLLLTLPTTGQIAVHPQLGYIYITSTSTGMLTAYNITMSTQVSSSSSSSTGMTPSSSSSSGVASSSSSSSSPSDSSSSSSSSSSTGASYSPSTDASSSFDAHSSSFIGGLLIGVVVGIVALLLMIVVLRWYRAKHGGSSIQQNGHAVLLE